MIRRLVGRARLRVGHVSGLMMRLVGLSMLGIAAPVAAAAPQPHSPVRIAVDLPYAPMESETPAGALEGFDIALGAALCRIARLPCQWVVQPWDGMVVGLMARKYDVILSAMAITPERAARFRIVGPYVTLGSAWFVPADGALSQISRDSVAGHRLGVQRGTMHDHYVTDTYGDVADIKRYQSVMDMRIDLQAGRLSAAFITRAVGQAMFNDGGRCYRAIAPRQPVSQAMGMAFRASDEALELRFEHALAEFKRSAAYAALKSRWLSTSP